MKIFISLLAMIVLPCALHAEIDKSEKSIIKAVEVTAFKGGIYVSDSDALATVLGLSANESFRYYFFQDGLVVKLLNTNLNYKLVDKIGLWRIVKGRIECHYDPGNEPDGPGDVFCLVQMRQADGKEVLFITSMLSEWSDAPTLDFLLKSYEYKKGIEDIDIQRGIFLRSLIP